MSEPSVTLTPAYRLDQSGPRPIGTDKLHPGETIAMVLVWPSEPHPAVARIAPLPAEDGAAAVPLVLTPHDPAAGGSDTLRLLLVGLDKFELPALTLQDAAGQKLATTAPLMLSLTSALKAEEQEPAPAHPQAAIGLDPVGVALVIGAAMGLAALVGWLALIWWRRGKSVPPAPPVPPIPADRRALEALDALLAGGCLERGEFKRFAVELAEIGKGYLGEVSGVPLLERTTEECARLLRGAGFVGARAAWLGGWLAELDLVKFAGAKPPLDELSAAALALRRVIEETRPQPTEASA